ncbi:MAG: master DNA invertase Mpi family serine-type recombinase [Treponema sp.]|nr:master DNA invertase Mpi family serine-type recombinase [Treponema sp.]MCL2271547.1 master DNA invertase Mpi family serine-type recombinase [Treponema sp.]
MIYGYIRVSTDKQTMDNQMFEIMRFCKSEKFEINRWITEKISGTKSVEKRQLGNLLKTVESGDIIICSELSRLGRSFFMIMSILSACMERGVKIWTIKDNYRLGDDIQSKVLAFAFGLSAEIERNLISQRTKEALARKKAEGKILGRRPGKLKKVRLTGHEKEIRKMIREGKNNVEIGKRFGVHRQTVRHFRRDRLTKRQLKKLFPEDAL